MSARAMEVFEAVAARRMTPDEGARALDTACWPPNGMDPALACAVCDGDCIPACIYFPAREERARRTP